VGGRGRSDQNCVHFGVRKYGGIVLQHVLDAQRFAPGFDFGGHEDIYDVFDFYVGEVTDDIFRMHFADPTGTKYCDNIFSHKIPPVFSRVFPNYL
jgi:hypothetical protein